MKIHEQVSLKGKTTMRIGGTARYFAELETSQDAEEAVAFAKEHDVPLIPLGGGSNTIFADGDINALIVRVKHDDVTINGDRVTVGAAKNLPMLINELATQGLDLSPLTGILGTVGGAVYGNAGQGPKGIWLDSFVVSVNAWAEGVWKTFSKDACGFGYRESTFKAMPKAPLIWEATLMVPTRDPADIEADIQRLLKQRLETQPHIKTAGSCFKAVGDTPAWQLIDTAGLRDTKSNGVHISEKHANFLINDGDGTFDDAVNVVKTITESVADGLEVEMRFVKEDGSLAF